MKSITQKGEEVKSTQVFLTGLTIEEKQSYSNFNK